MNFVKEVARYFTGWINPCQLEEKDVDNASFQSTWKLKVSQSRKDAIRVKIRKVFHVQCVSVSAGTQSLSGPNVDWNTQRIKLAITVAIMRPWLTVCGQLVAQFREPNEWYWRIKLYIKNRDFVIYKSMWYMSRCDISDYMLKDNLIIV